MCGICGILKLDGDTVDPQNLTRMTSTMVHRGPDDGGIWSQGPVGLGHRRLSILDLSPNGHQPMLSPDESAVISFNGEVYNFTEIRQTLKTFGWAFCSRSDTEVILKAYLQFGEDFVRSLDGIFAFAIWDAREKKLFLARDRLGVKPLYYHHNDKEFIFASEAKAILAVMPSLAECNSDKLWEYLVFRDIAGHETLFKGIRCVPAGTVFIVDSQGLRQKRFWSLNEAYDNGQVDHLDPEELENTLRETVRSQMVSDVPVGTLCSGGLDSSLVTAYASECSGQKIHTFSVAFSELRCDESAYAQAVAAHLGTYHHVLTADPECFSSSLDVLTWHNDEPISHPNSVFINLICRLARANGVIVLLTGEGTDELFVGYGHTINCHRVQQVRPWGGGLSTGEIWRGLGGLNAASRFARLMAALMISKSDLSVFSTAFGKPYLVQRLLGLNVAAEPEIRSDMADSAREYPPGECGRALDLLAYLPSILLRQDKMSMAASVESRVPILGNRLIDLALTTSIGSMIHGRTGKIPLRALANKKLPPVISSRRKMGFGLPLSSWFRESRGLRGSLEKLSSTGAHVASYLDCQVIQNLVNAHLQSKEEHAEMLWILMALETWLGVLGDWRTGRQTFARSTT